MSIRILITSPSKIKADAVTKFFKTQFNKEINLDTINCAECKLPEQPIIDDNNEGHYFAKERMNFARTIKNFDDYDYVVSIENGIEIGLNYWDMCYVLLYHKGLLSKGTSFAIPIEPKYLSILEEKHKLIEYNPKIYGYDMTAGKLMAQEDNKIDPRNWMKSTVNIDRVDQIIYAIKESNIKMEKKIENKVMFMNAYKSYQDYPKEGVLFHDIFPLFKDRLLFKQLIKLIVSQYKFDVIDYVVGLEARGFCLGTVIAYKLGVGFVPIRKAGKLPGKTIQLGYEKEYGKDICEIQCDELNGKRILIVDDLIATGGSMKVAIDLLKLLQCTIVDCLVLRDVPELKDKYKSTMENNKYSILLQ